MLYTEENRIPLRKMGQTTKNGSHLEKWVKLWKISNNWKKGSNLKKKMGHLCETGSHLEKWVTLQKWVTLRKWGTLKEQDLVGKIGQT